MKRRAFLRSAGIFAILADSPVGAYPKTPPSGDFVRSIIWKNVLINGTEYFALGRTPSGWSLEGTVVGILEETRPLLARYEIECDENWWTRRVHVERRIAKNLRAADLVVERHGVWRSSGHTVSEIQGCDDVDLALTPATNTIPIRRLSLQIGESRSITATWIKLPTEAAQHHGAELIHYRNHSGFATISFKDFRQPTLRADPRYLRSARVQMDGPDALLLVSSAGQSPQLPDPQYEVVSVSNPANPLPLATIQGVIQRIDGPETGTIFLLTDRGVNVVRCLSSEQDHEIDINKFYE